MEKQVINQEELEVLKNLQTRTQNLIVELGEVELVKLQLNNRYEKATELLKTINKAEEEFTQNIIKKYGNIHLNPETGEFTKLD